MSESDSIAYGSAQFAESFNVHGDVFQLSHSGLYVIKRFVYKDKFDLTGVYPFSICKNWSGLVADIEELKNSGAVSLTFVADPFSELELAKASDKCQWSLFKTYKTHFTVDTTVNWQKSLSKNTRRLCRRALEIHQVEMLASSEETAKQFWILHQNLVRKHNISGLGKITLSMLKQQLTCSGTYVFAASVQGTIYGAVIVYLLGERAYWYLLASHEKSYTAGTNYALFFATLTWLEKQGIRWVNLGGNSGTNNNITDGLAKFKKKWSNSIFHSSLCGKILNPTSYEELMLLSKTTQEKNFFPAYRSPNKSLLYNNDFKNLDE